MGVFVDSSLNWKLGKTTLIIFIKKIIKFTSIFYKLRDKVSPEVLKMMYFFFVCPHLLFRIEIYANTDEYILKKISCIKL